MSNLDRIAERLIAGSRPTSLDIDIVIALYERMGWTHRRGATSHHKFAKSGERTRTVTEESRKKVGKASIDKLIDDLRKGWDA